MGRRGLTARSRAPRPRRQPDAHRRWPRPRPASFAPNDVEASAAARESVTCACQSIVCTQIDARCRPTRWLQRGDADGAALWCSPRARTTPRLEETDRLRHRAPDACTVRSRQAWTGAYAGGRGENRHLSLHRPEVLLERQTARPSLGPRSLTKRQRTAHPAPPSTKAKPASAIIPLPRHRLPCAIWRALDHTRNANQSARLGLLHRGRPTRHQQSHDVSAPRCAFAAAPPRRCPPPRPLTAQQLRATHEEVGQQIDAPLDADTDAQDRLHRPSTSWASRTGAGEASDRPQHSSASLLAGSKPYRRPLDARLATGNKIASSARK